MPRWGMCDFRELEAFVKRMGDSDRAKYAQFCAECARELTARLLAKVINRTPVGSYGGGGKTGGTLRRGWTARTEEEAGAGGSKDPATYAASLPITKQGNIYEIEIMNPVRYASYVETGHRTRKHKGWVKGQFMLEISTNELETESKAILEKKIRKFLEDCFNG